MEMSRRAKKAAVIIAVVLAVLVALSATRDFAIRQAIVLFGGHVTGTTVEMDSFLLSLVRQSVAIRGFRMHHPTGFETGLLVDVPAVSLDLDAWALLKGKLHIQSAEMRLTEMVLIRNRQGKLNVDSLKVAQKKPAAGTSQQPGTKTPKMLPLQIDVLTLELGRVVMKDYTKGEEPKITVYDLNVKKTYKNITSAEQLAMLVMIEPMKSAGVTGAAIYGAAAVAGVAFLPAVAVAAVVGDDSAQKEFSSKVDRVYAEALALVKTIGTVKKEDKAGGVIRASIRGTDMTIAIQKKERKTRVTVTARKFMMPKPTEASGFLYRLAERLREK